MAPTFIKLAAASGEDVPRAYLATAVGHEIDGDDAPVPTRSEKRARAEASASAATSRQYRCGVELLSPSDDGSSSSISMLDVIEPVGIDGLVRDWDALEALWSHAAKDYLAIDAAEHPVLLAERPYAPRARARAAELLFEGLKAPSAFIAKDATLACFACGRSSGLVMDLGASGTVATPVHDGWCEKNAVVRSAVGARAVERYLTGAPRCTPRAVAATLRRARRCGCDARRDVRLGRRRRRERSSRLGGGHGGHRQGPCKLCRVHDARDRA